MKSPFPGIDPFIEACGLWRDFHDRLLGDIEQALAGRMPEQYFMRLGARTYLVGDEKPVAKSALPAAPSAARTKGKSGKLGKSGSAARGKAADEAPIQMLAPLEIEEKEIFIEIHQARPERRLVTTIEILSPANKQPDSPGWEAYLNKRQAILNGAANFVEIDLLRGGRRMPMRQPWPDSPGYLLVARRSQVPRCSVWKAHAARPLPQISIPLDYGDADVEIDLQPMLDSIYERTGLAGLIDYKRSVSPPLSAAEKKLLAKAPKRRPKRK